MRKLQRHSTSVRLFPYVHNCCGLEWQAFLLPRYQHKLRAKVDVVERIEQANTLLVGGELTEEHIHTLKELHARMKAPKIVMAFGVCQMTETKLGDSLPVTMYVPGCAPSPESLVMAMNEMTEVFQEKPTLEKVQNARITY